MIADNCTDNTAEVARAHGADVYTTVDNHHRKAGGLNQLLARLLPTLGPLDAVLVMDADTVMVDDFLERAAAEFDDLPDLDAVGGVFVGDDSPGLLSQLQRNEYLRYGREISRRKGRVFVLTGTASVFRADALAAVAAARGSVLPGVPGDVYDTFSLTEDNELTLALKTLGARMVSPRGCRVTTELMPTWRDLWHQRQRWQRGALENIGMYGMSSATARYWAQQLALGYGVLALAAYLAITVLAYFAFGVFTVVVFWALHRRPLHRRTYRHRVARRLASTTAGGAVAHRARLRHLPAVRLRQVAHRHRPRPLQTVERRHRRGAIPMSSWPPWSLTGNRWFVLLGVFVAFNTVVYAALAFSKLWPRRRR